MTAPISKLPAPAGASPFRVKGTSLLAIHQHAASVPGGLDAVVGLFDDPGERERPRARRRRAGALPAFLAPWFAAMLQGYVSFAMERAGARHPALRARDLREDGARGGLPTATLSCVVTWS